MATLTAGFCKGWRRRSLDGTDRATLRVDQLCLPINSMVGIIYLSTSQRTCFKVLATPINFQLWVLFQPSKQVQLNKYTKNLRFAIRASTPVTSTKLHVCVLLPWLKYTQLNKYSENLRLTMVATIGSELINHETCPKCTFGNISGAAKCEKCGEPLTGGNSVTR